MAGSSTGGGFNGNRKHGFGRFSLGRFFNISALTHRSSSQHCSSSSEGDRHSEGTSSNNVSTKVNTGTRERVCFVSLSGPANAAGSSSYLDENLDEKFDETCGEPSQDYIECPLCLFELPRLCFPELSSCSHRACYNCMQQYLKIEITESRVNISCPECTEPIHPSDIRMILNDDVLIFKYESFMLRRVLVTEPDARWCPAPDCGYAVIAHGCAGCPKLKCERPGCNTFFCYHCKQEWHPNQTCDAARAQRSRHNAHPRSSSVSFSQDSMIHMGDDIKPCPCCKVLIIKMDDGSCNHMTCSVCGTEFCWLCMKEISDLHYLSPSGCTFWGKKPWSRKKKIMWQLGMLVGAPVGIALIAGIAVPAIIIGIPVWVGRKLHAKYTRPSTGRHRRNLIVSSGIVASMLISPILAGIAVGIGVPILLAYVYGVVPISLCRSGGCGVSTSASGVRIEFDEENEIGMGNNPVPGNFDGGSVVSQRGVNPSIGEVSLVLSTSISLGSGSHLDRIGTRDRESDRESASNVALAGSIASASLVSGAHKLEIQADVSSNKRFSLSSHSETASATVSLSERSANMSLADDASTKALAGSLLGYKDNTAVTPVEVHVDAHGSLEEIRLTETGRDFAHTGCPADSIIDVATASKNEQFSCAQSYTDTSSLGSARLKLWKGSKKKKQHNSPLQDEGSDFFKNADNASLKSESYSFTGHVHFSDLKEDSVTFIDESPCNESSGHFSQTTSEILLMEGENPVNMQTLKQILQSAMYCSETRTNCLHDATEASSKGLVKSSRGLKAKLVSRSVSFCNSCSSTHKQCCPDAFNYCQNCPTKSRVKYDIRHSEPSALVNRAYKMPCGMHHILDSVPSDAIFHQCVAARTRSMDQIMPCDGIDRETPISLRHTGDLACESCGSQPYSFQNKYKPEVKTCRECSTKSDVGSSSS